MISAHWRPPPHVKKPTWNLCDWPAGGETTGGEQAEQQLDGGEGPASGQPEIERCWGGVRPLSGRPGQPSHPAGHRSGQAQLPLWWLAALHLSKGIKKGLKNVSSQEQLQRDPGKYLEGKYPARYPCQEVILFKFFIFISMCQTQRTSFIHLKLKEAEIKTSSESYIAWMELPQVNVIEITTLQSIMNAKLSQHRFWHCHENRLIKTIQTLPHTTCFWVSSRLPFTED